MGSASFFDRSMMYKAAKFVHCTPSMSLFIYINHKTVYTLSTVFL